MPQAKHHLLRLAAAAAAAVWVLAVLAGCEVAVGLEEHADSAAPDASHGGDAERIRSVPASDAVQLRGNEVRLLLLRRGR